MAVMKNEASLRAVDCKVKRSVCIKRVEKTLHAILNRGISPSLLEKMFATKPDKACRHYEAARPGSASKTHQKV